MKIHLIIRDLGGGQPVIQQVGTNGNTFSFSWNKAFAGHVRTYDLSREEEFKRFKREQFEILNQKLMWPIFVAAEVDPAEGSAEIAEQIAALEARIQEVGELAADRLTEIERLKVTVAERDAALMELRAQLSKSQDGQAASRQAHNPEIEGSNPSPATNSIQEGDSSGPSEKPAAPSPEPPAKAKGGRAKAKPE